MSASLRALIAELRDTLDQWQSSASDAGASNDRHRATVFRACAADIEQIATRLESLVGVEPKPDAWEHTLTVEGQPMPRLSYSKRHDFGRRGIDHGGKVTSRPLVYASPPTPKENPND